MGEGTRAEAERGGRRGHEIGRFLPRETARHLKAAIAETQMATRSLVFALIDRLQVDEEAEGRPGETGRQDGGSASA